MRFQMDRIMRTSEVVKLTGLSKPQSTENIDMVKMART